MIDGSFYRLLSFLSPSYPIGSFHYSHGIEYAVDCGIIYDRSSLEEWVVGILQFGSGRNDGIFFKTACDAVRTNDVSLFDRLLIDGSAFRQTSELWLESSDQGEAALKILTQFESSPYVKCFKRLS
jgi:urease accessory protein